MHQSLIRSDCKSLLCFNNPPGRRTALPDPAPGRQNCHGTIWWIRSHMVRVSTVLSTGASSWLYGHLCPHTPTNRRTGNCIWTRVDIVTAFLEPATTSELVSERFKRPRSIPAVAARALPVLAVPALI